MLKADQFLIAPNLKQHKFPLTDEWIKKLFCILTNKWYSAIKILIQTTTSMDLKILLNERRPTKVIHIV